MPTYDVLVERTQQGTLRLEAASAEEAETMALAPGFAKVAWQEAYLDAAAVELEPAEAPS